MSLQDHVGDEDESFIPEEVTDHNTWNEAEVVQSRPFRSMLRSWDLYIW